MQVKSLLGFTVWSLTAQTEQRPLRPTRSLQSSVFYEPTDEKRWSERGLIDWRQPWFWRSSAKQTDVYLKVSSSKLCCSRPAEDLLQNRGWKPEGILCFSGFLSVHQGAAEQWDGQSEFKRPSVKQGHGRTDGRAERLTARLISYCC